jgi:hypothetical protein
MACQCGCSTAAPRADVPHGADCECGCSTSSSPEGLDVASLARLVKELDQRVRQLELETSRN